MKRTSKRNVTHRSPTLMDVGNVCIHEVQACEMTSHRKTVAKGNDNRGSRKPCTGGYAWVMSLPS